MQYVYLYFLIRVIKLYLLKMLNNKMRFKNIILLGFILVCLSSCISRKQLTYLQENESLVDSVSISPLSIKPYRVQISDVLSISLKANDPELVAIFQKSETSQSTSGNINEASMYLSGYVVDAHGNIRIPLVGEINVLGYTVEDIRNKIEELLLKDYLTEQAQLFVVVKLAGISFTVTGEVSSPGRLTMFKDRVNIIEALASAGDVVITGDKKDVVIVRQYPGGTKIHHLDVTDATVINSPYYYIVPNDMIIVNPLPQKALGTGTDGMQTFTTIFSIFSVITSTILLIRTL